MSLLKLISRYKTVLSYSTTSILQNIIQIIANIIIIKWISPDELGIWNTILVIKNYSLVLNLGVSNGLNRELPFFLGKKFTNISELITQNGLYISILASIVSFVSISCYGLFFIDNQITSLSYISLALVISLNFINLFYGTTYRTNKSFDDLSKINVFISIVSVVSIVFTYYFHYTGFLIGVVVFEIVRLIFMYKYRPMKIYPKFKMKGFLILFKTGILFFINTYISSISETFKRIFLKNFSSFYIVGLYSPALAIHTANNLIPKTLGKYIYPKMNYQLGANVAQKVIWDSMIKYILLNIVITIPFIIIGWFTLPYLISNFFSEYIDGIFAAQLALLSGLFIPFQIIINFFHSLKKWRIIFIISGIKLFIYFLFQFTFVQILSPLTGISIGVLLSDIVFSVYLFTYGYRRIKKSNY